LEVLLFTMSLVLFSLLIINQKSIIEPNLFFFSFKSVEPDQKMVKLLVSKGFNSDLVKKALIFANNDLSQATLFLKSGNMLTITNENLFISISINSFNSFVSLLVKISVSSPSNIFESKD